MKTGLNADLSTIGGLVAGTLHLIDHNRGVPGSVPGRTKKCSDSRLAKSFSGQRDGSYTIQRNLPVILLICGIEDKTRETPVIFYDHLNRLITATSNGYGTLDYEPSTGSV